MNYMKNTVLVQKMLPVGLMVYNTLFFKMKIWGSYSIDDSKYSMNKLFSTAFYHCLMTEAIISELHAHFFLMVGTTLSVPYIVTPLLCLQDDDPSRGKIISSIFFVSGIVTLLQTTLGCRLPVIQGATFAFLLPTIAIMNTSFDSCQTYDYANLTSFEKDEIWMRRMRAIQGAVTVASVTEVFIGLTGLLLGLSLFRTAANKASTHWGISLMTASLFVLFSQYLSRFVIPVQRWKNNKFFVAIYKIFTFFPILSAILISWAVSAILTAFEVFPEDSEARTDNKISLVLNSSWFYVPYPFQWGIPTVSASGVIGIIAGILSSVVESIGDYYACSRLAESGPLPEHAINRGIFIEGIGCIIAGIIGTGNGTTTCSANIATLRITKWLHNPGSIQTGSPAADQVLLVLLKTSMFVGGMIGFFLDNTVPVLAV
ncbi:Solute carrier family 23 member 2 [Armadillidium vulgare]|nr:Solute carrier family 23 member 2 [Armadillidium vulgare]